MDTFYSVQQMAEIWKISPRRIQTLCAQGRVPGAKMRGHSWFIPAHEKKPEDLRRKGKNVQHPLLELDQEDAQIHEKILQETEQLVESGEEPDFEQILKIDFRERQYGKILNQSYVQLALEILWNCPQEIKNRNPLSLMRLTWGLADGRYQEVFERLLEDCHSAVEAYTCTKMEKQQLQGEYEFLRAFLHYPDIKAMLPSLRSARKLCIKPI